MFFLLWITHFKIKKTSKFHSANQRFRSWCVPPYQSLHMKKQWDSFFWYIIGRALSDMSEMKKVRAFDLELVDEPPQIERTDRMRDRSHVLPDVRVSHWSTPKTASSTVPGDALWSPSTLQPPVLSFFFFLFFFPLSLPRHHHHGRWWRCLWQCWRGEHRVVPTPPHLIPVRHIGLAQTKWNARSAFSRENLRIKRESEREKGSDWYWKSISMREHDVQRATCNTHTLFFAVYQ